MANKWYDRIRSFSTVILYPNYRESLELFVTSLYPLSSDIVAENPRWAMFPKEYACVSFVWLI